MHAGITNQHVPACKRTLFIDQGATLIDDIAEREWFTRGRGALDEQSRNRDFSNDPIEPVAIAQFAAQRLLLAQAKSDRKPASIRRTGEHRHVGQTDARRGHNVRKALPLAEAILARQIGEAACLTSPSANRVCTSTPFGKARCHLSHSIGMVFE